MSEQIPFTAEAGNNARLADKIAEGIAALYRHDRTTATSVLAEIESHFYVTSPDGEHVPDYNHPCMQAFSQLAVGIQDMFRPTEGDL